ncbi:chromosomal replication initiator protein DnaA [Actinomyces sp. B33]|uniref:chromosomal replication initiator protein DnaA n=1 Tax=Actinomyces sp. B33 TaxID=2942131 RepID=UPI00234045F0|nr:chromosomal replication initiator protein DnaA [Actinomyces sp. B33]MDC4232545.1 chromosomal replication initiator protein DnaA [Actinomyces sp. B33]
MENDSLERAWTRALDSLDTEKLGPATTNYLRVARPLGDIEGTILLAVPDAFTKSWIESHAADQITTSLSLTMGRTIRIAITVDPALAPASDDEPTSEGEQEPQAPAPSPEAPAPTPPAPASSTGTPPTHLNAKYTFDTFVIGPSNRFAHAAAFAVSETPGTAFNPLFIYGDSGLGKTHLLHAIGHYALSLYPHLKVRYVSSEEFTNEFINAIRLNKTDNSQVEAFHRRYRELDVLLIDDIQFIGDKEQTVEGFFHTFNALYEADKQIVLTSDVAPNKLSGFEDRMRSRFASGLLVDVQPPDLETRIAILQKKAAGDSLEIGPDVLEYIASRISSNIRELEGALLRVIAFANLSKERIDLPLAEMMLKDFVSDPSDNEITVPLIMGQCAHYFGVTIDQLCSTDRSHDVVEARQVAMYLCRELTDLSLPKIGSAFDRDHTTVMYANKKIVSLMKEKRETFNQVTELTNRIKQKARES